MNRPLLIAIAAAFCLVPVSAGTAAAKGSSGWGWAKPMNKRMGAFYTSNKNANFSRSSQSKQHYRSHSQPRQASQVQPAAGQHAAIQHIPTQQQPIQHLSPIQKPFQPHWQGSVINNGQAITLPHLRNQGGAKASVHPPAASPASPAKPKSKETDTLPFKSTTNTFWQ